jgi:hypothetical protein
MESTRLARSVAVAAVLVLVIGCRRTPALQPKPVAELQFAADYIKALRDSGAVAVLPRLHPRTRALPNVESNLTVLHNVLETSHAELSLVRWTIRQVIGKPRMTEVTYASQTIGAPSEVGVWIMNYEGRLVVETFFAGRPVSSAPTP